MKGECLMEYSDFTGKTYDQSEIEEIAELINQQLSEEIKNIQRSEGGNV